MDQSNSQKEELLLDTDNANFGVELSIKLPSIAINAAAVSNEVDSFSSESGSTSYSDNYDDYTFSEDYLSESNNTTMEMMCMSPPGARVIKNHKTKTKNGKPKKTRLKKTRHIKRPNLVNSASNLELKEDTSKSYLSSMYIIGSLYISLCQCLIRI